MLELDQVPFICWPCRTGRCTRCDRIRGCEHTIVGLDDHGRIVLCSALFETMNPRRRQ